MTWNWFCFLGPIFQHIFHVLWFIFRHGHSSGSHQLGHQATPNWAYTFIKEVVESRRRTKWKHLAKYQLGIDKLNKAAVFQNFWEKKNSRKKSDYSRQNHVTISSLSIGGFPWGKKIEVSMHNNKTKIFSFHQIDQKNESERAGSKELFDNRLSLALVFVFTKGRTCFTPRDWI